MADDPDYTVVVRPHLSPDDTAVDDFVADMLGMSRRDEFGECRMFGLVAPHDEINELPVFWYVGITVHPDVHVHLETDYNIIELNPRGLDEIRTSQTRVVRRYVLYPHWYTDSKPNLYERCEEPQRIAMYADGRRTGYFMCGWVPN